MDSDRIKGRGAQQSVNNRFSSVQYEHDEDSSHVDLKELDKGVKTEYIKIFPKKIVNDVPSPDINMDYSMNPYQGCEHGCTYCYARNTHDYWGYGPGLDFERKILYKPNAPELLIKKLESKSWKPAPIMLSGNTDCYQPAERKFELTRQLLQICLDYKNPVGIITKNSLIERDLDILSEMAKHKLIVVNMSINTMDESLKNHLEPRTSSIKRRMMTIKALSSKGVPVYTLIGPVIPGLNSHDIPQLIEKSAEMGALWANYVMIRLNGAVGDIFTDWVQKTYPDRASKVLNQIRELNGGQLNNSRFGTRMSGKGILASSISNLFEIHRKKYMSKPDFQFNLNDFQVPSNQLRMF